MVGSGHARVGCALSKLRARQKIGKYRILGRIASGPLADVYKAFDPIHRERVALKIPAASAYSGDEEFLHEVQVARKLQHPNILSVINASYIDDHFVIAMELGDESLADRIERRISTARAMDLAGQGLAALAHAHEHRVVLTGLRHDPIDRPLGITPRPPGAVARPAGVQRTGGPCLDLAPAAIARALHGPPAGPGRDIWQAK